MMTINSNARALFQARPCALFAVALAMTALLTACGGGGGGDGTAGAAKSAAAGTTVSGTESDAASAASSASYSGGGTAVASPATSTAQSAANSTAASTSTGSSATPVSLNNSTGSSAPVSAPAPVNASASIFYGANGHNNEGGAYDISSPARQLSQLQDLGVKLYRNEVYSQATATKLAGIARSMAAGGVTVFPVLLSDPRSFNSETDAYDAGFALGQQTATSYRYPYYEVSNELGALALVGNVDGVYPQHFNNAIFQKARGVIRGMIAGIKSVDTNGKIVMGGETWLHYGFDEMLWNGTQPDGTTGHPKVTWDITGWHWYSDQGDITRACGGTGCHDVLAALQAFGKPIWLTEFGVRPSYGSDAQIASYMVGNTMMAQFVAVASRYNLQAIQVYELYDDPVGGEGNYGLLMNDGVTQKPVYAAFKNFVAGHPM
ncbi:glycosyl hydrolase [Caballeronia sp. BCC1704]|uniref:glycosyl hydrolase n=1 Tax=Caballeronia sp. BCC1704 TaxID=2676300 RepID=UPI001FC89DA0|nr:glycosyl hydrolase [Caballeronia sp. BCC1704]